MLGVIAVATTAAFRRRPSGGLATFAGMKRRQDVRGVAAGVTVNRRLRHHPTAVRATLQATRDRYPAGASGDLRAAHNTTRPESSRRGRRLATAHRLRSRTGAEEISERLTEDLRAPRGTERRFQSRERATASSRDRPGSAAGNVVW